MENRFTEHKLTKQDILFLLCILIIGTIAFLWYKFSYQTKGSQVEITIDGTLYGVYDLTKEDKVTIKGNDDNVNTVIIKNNSVQMIEASCPDKLCIHHKQIQAVGESIVCLPNKVVVTVIMTQEDTALKEQTIDSIVK